MDFSSISKIVLGIVTSVGGIGAIIIGVAHFLSDNIAEKLSKKYEMQMNKQLEEYKAKLDNGNHISRALFDKEFDAYQSLSETFTVAYNKIETYHGITASGTNVMPITDLMNLASSDNDQEKMDFLFKSQKGEIITEMVVNNLISEIPEKMMAFRLELGKNAALISYENYKLYLDLYNSVFVYMKSKGEEDYQAITFMLGKLQANLRKYLRELTIIE